MTHSSDKKIIIKGITDEGKLFRPTDWAERMSGALASFKNCRIYYSPLLQPSITDDGAKCILLDPNLKYSRPQIYEAIMEFAKLNHLKIGLGGETEKK